MILLPTGDIITSEDTLENDIKVAENNLRIARKIDNASMTRYWETKLELLLATKENLALKKRIEELEKQIEGMKNDKGNP